MLMWESVSPTVGKSPDVRALLVNGHKILASHETLLMSINSLLLQSH